MHPPARNSLLGGLAPEHFLAEYWQQKPLLIRDAWPGFVSPISPEALAGLACEEGVNPRLVQRFDQRWQVRHGPFQASDFTALPDQFWTVLVPDSEKHLPELRAILEPFRFIPDWRIDDLMISYAASQGSVGPHVDNYDVFLLQGLGHRRWQINTQASGSDALLVGSELRLLQAFTPEHEWVLKPGDMLYLPPGIAHYGLALDACMTFSIGFRAPAIQDLVADFCDYLIQRCANEVFLRDSSLRNPDMLLASHPGQITDQALAQIQTLLQQNLSFNAAEIRHWFGRFITEAQTELSPEPLRPPLTAEQLADHLAQSPCWQRDAATRFAFILEPSGAMTVFIDAKLYALAPDGAWFGKLVCDHIRYRSDELLLALNQTQTRTVLLEWVNQAYLVPLDNDDEEE